MAITSAELQTALGATLMTSPQVLRAYGTFGTTQQWLIDGGVTYPGRTQAISTTASDNAATQATTITTALSA